MKKTASLTAAVVATFTASQALANAADLTVFDWSGYEDQGFYGDYVEKYGGPPSYTYFGSVEEAFTKLQSGFEADLAHPCTDALRKWVAADMIKPIDTSKLENWDKLMPKIKEVDGITIDGQTYMVPFEWGNTGLIYRTDMVSADDVSLQLLMQIRPIRARLRFRMPRPVHLPWRRIGNWRFQLYRYERRGIPESGGLPARDSSECALLLV